MRGWMNEAKSYIRPVAIGEIMRAGTGGKVIASKNPKFKEGDIVTGGLGVQEYAVSDGKGIIKVDTRLIPLTTYMGTLGMPGMTAYFGLLDIGKPQAGQTVVVSGAAGAVGSVVGQIAKIKGCRVVGIAVARTSASCSRASSLRRRDRLQERGREGRAQAALSRRHRRLLRQRGRRNPRRRPGSPRAPARIVICGAISQYNNTAPVKGPSNYMSLLVNRASMTGMVVFDYAARYGEAAREMAQWIAQGKLKAKEDDTPGGIDAFPEC
jgi:NADPH-dependent curcumin reductase CurA